MDNVKQFDPNAMSIDELFEFAVTYGNLTPPYSGAFDFFGIEHTADKMMRQQTFDWLRKMAQYAANVAYAIFHASEGNDFLADMHKTWATEIYDSLPYFIRILFSDNYELVPDVDHDHDGHDHDGHDHNHGSQMEVQSDD